MWNVRKYYLIVSDDVKDADKSLKFQEAWKWIERLDYAECPNKTIRKDNIAPDKKQQSHEDGITSSWLLENSRLNWGGVPSLALAETCRIFVYPVQPMQRIWPLWTVAASCELRRARES